ncbi:response regulator [Bradyrhizobium sp. ISRA443]|uniref:response regulator n=1 Tax=unclassified Bradyrhizobium TaxID=2631580 RepID=UPI0024787C41|nr:MULTISPECIES: response regulator [unclassified Bradyrhizobium]WGR98635.1 response regulator [Bradyrhizobium sp. ISRA436]WGS05524.1 response regulator [Bradyrhizobium sp. ISRA437]WGS12411.1 response regulator [Bradyrhizobium sp. ISRA443]
MNAAGPRGRDSIDQADIRFLVEKNADGIVVVDEDGTVLFVNPAAEQIFGRTREVLIGSQIGIPLIGGETTEIALHRPGGDSAEAEIRVVETTWDRRPALLASLRDISARKATEERLRQSAKMEAVGRLTAGIAHDFNNLLTVVLGNLESARRQSSAATARIQALDNATRGARRAAALTERLLAFARQKPLAPVTIDVNELVLGMSDLLQRTLGESINVRSALDPAAWNIETDPTELEAAILNLAVNARDAMPNGGELMIETANVQLDRVYAAANAEVTAGPHVMIAVADTGTGMSPDILKKVFEPFFTTKPDGRGTGLGLSQVYGFVKQTGGHVKLYSEPGIGTTVKVYFPKVAESRRALQPSDCQKMIDQVPLAGESEGILVVEDDEDVRNYTVSSLCELGYVVFAAIDAASALEILDREDGIHLLFTDLGLPGAMDGRALADRIRAIKPSVKILITTAYAGSVLVREGRLAPGVELLSKPFSFAALASRIRELLDRRQEGQEGDRILVVDDEVLIRMLVVDALARAGLEAEEAGSFHEALAKIRSVGDKLAAAIVDLGLPDKPGDGLVAEIRALWPDLPIVLATGYVSEDLRRRFEQDVLLHIVAKPFDLEALMATLERLGFRARRRGQPSS